MKKRTIAMVLMIICDAAFLVAQLPNPLKGKGVTVNGMIGANHIYYNAYGIPNRNIPFNFLYNGNLSVNIFDKIKMPVSFSFSNQNINFSNPFNRNYRFAQPLNRLMLKPNYKGLTLHIGTAALNFSPYTLAGHRFDGLGLEYKPKNKPFYVAAMTGNLQRAVAVDTLYTVRNNRPAYKRTGYGFMTGYRHKKDKAEVIFFHAKDKLALGNLDALNLSPAENAAIALKAEKAIAKKWQVGGEIAYTGITTDIRAEGRQLGKAPFLKNFFGTIDSKTSTDYLKALKGFFTYSTKKLQTGFDYSRIDPGYRTLGAYFFTNDLETFAAKFATNLMAGKLTLAANAGVQHDNVWKQKPKTLSRNVGSLNVNYMPTEKININAAYSNFTSFSNIMSNYAYLTQLTPYNYLDTLTFRQINSNLQSNISWQLPAQNDHINSTLTAALILQNGADENASAYSKNGMQNLNLDYAIENQSKKIGGNVAFNFTKTNFGNMPNTQYGPSLGLNFERFKIKNSLNILYAMGSMPDVKEQITNIRYGAQYAFKDKHKLKFDGIFLKRAAQSTERSIPNFAELTLTLGYVYNFTLIDKKVK